MARTFPPGSRESRKPMNAVGPDLVPEALRHPSFTSLRCSGRRLSSYYLSVSLRRVLGLVIQVRQVRERSTLKTAQVPTEYIVLFDNIPMASRTPFKENHPVQPAL